MSKIASMARILAVVAALVTSSCVHPQAHQVDVFVEYERYMAAVETAKTVADLAPFHCRSVHEESVRRRAMPSGRSLEGQKKLLGRCRLLDWRTETIERDEAVYLYVRCLDEKLGGHVGINVLMEREGGRWRIRHERLLYEHEASGVNSPTNASSAALGRPPPSPPKE